MRYILKSEKTLFLFLILLLFGISAFHIFDLCSIVMIHDEYAYWGNAAFFAGVDWFSGMKNIPYYSFGNSLILAPIFAFVDSPENMYRLSSLANVFLLLGSFIITYGISKKVFEFGNKKFGLLIIFVMLLYPAYITNVNYSWPENLLYFLTCLLIWLAVSICEKKNWYSFLFFGILNGYSYAVHNRTIGIVLASCVFMILLRRLTKISIKQLILFFGSLILTLAVYIYLKEFVVKFPVGDSVNSYGGQINKILNIFTLDGFINFLFVLFGHIFYIGSASFLLVYFAFAGICSDIFKIIKEKKFYKLNLRMYFYIFTLFAFVFSVGVSVLFMSGELTRYDTYVYGRYAEIFIPMLMLIGIDYFIRFAREKSVKKTVVFLIVSVVLFIISTLVVLCMYSIKEPLKFNYVMVFSGMRFSEDFLWSVVINFIISVVVAGGIFVSFVISKKTVFKCLCLCIIATLFVSVAEFATFRTSLSNQKELRNLQRALKKSQAKNEHFNVLYYSGGEDREDRIKGYVQYALKNKTVYFTDKDEIRELNDKNEKNIVISCGVLDEFLFSNYEFLDLGFAYDVNVWEKDNEGNSKTELKTKIPMSKLNYIDGFNEFEGDTGLGFRWTSESNSFILGLDENNDNIIRIEHYGTDKRIFEKNKELVFKLLYNGSEIGTYVLTEQNVGDGYMEFVLDKELYQKEKSHLFTLEGDTWSQSDFGGSDTRKLGIMVFSIKSYVKNN